MAKQRLLTPGPTEVPEAALLSMARQVTHHRTPEFRSLLAEVFAGLKYVFATENDVLLLTSSGTGAMEAAVVNLVPQGGKAIVLDSGKFAERWRKICEAFGIEVVRYEVPWGAAFEADEVARLLEEHPDAVAVFATLLETSTGVGHDIEAIGRVGRAEQGAVGGRRHQRRRRDGVPDRRLGHRRAGGRGPKGPDDAAGVGLFGGQSGRMEADRVDPPAGLLLRSAWRIARRLEDSDTPYTPAIPLVKALAESLRAIRAVGIERVWARTRVLAQAMRAGIEALGLRLVAARPADGMTAVYFPDGLDGKAFLERLQTRFGIKLAGGQGPLKGRIFRIAHMGTVDELDVLSTLAAIELVLAEMGQDVKLGASVAAASRVLAAAAYEYHVREKVENSLRQADAGEVVSQEEVEREFGLR